MIDALFGSKTRVKLLHLFLNNPNKSFYVREITRIIDEQINSVRRELSNMLSIGIISSDSVDNKLYYKTNRSYEYYKPLREIFGDNIVPDKEEPVEEQVKLPAFVKKLESIKGVDVVIMSGHLVDGSKSEIDLMVSCSANQRKISAVISDAEKSDHIEIRFTVMPYDEFYYRLSIRDRFIIDILSDKHVVAVDNLHVLG